MKNNNLENRIEEYYKNETKNIPQLSDDEKEKLKRRIAQNSLKRKTFVKKRFAIISAILIIVLIPSILIPVLTIGSSDDIKYYSDTEVTQEELTLDFVQTYINQNYSKYSFIFDECEVTYKSGYYSSDDRELLSLNLELFLLEPPFATIKFDIILNKGLDLRKYNKVKDEGEKYETNEYTKYRKDYIISHKINRIEVVEYTEYNIYLNIDVNDDEVFNKFY